MRKVTKTLMILSRLCWLAFAAQLLAGFFVDLPTSWGWYAIGAAMAARLSAGRFLGARPGRGPGPRPERGPVPSREVEPVEVEPPVAGRWSALNSPADKVPSHGTRAYGQAYAIDVTAEPEDRPRPAFGWWPIVRRNRAFPAFGEPLLACADATVVRATDRQRDHLSRNSYPALAYLFVEGFFRDMVSPSMVVGNHVILDLGDGTYAVYAHVKRGSLTVRAGDRVRVGQRIAMCGNSGNTTEPHLHFQLMDTPDFDTARGIPFSWRGVGVPANREIFSVPVSTVA